VQLTARNAAPKLAPTRGAARHLRALRAVDLGATDAVAEAALRLTETALLVGLSAFAATYVLTDCLGWPRIFYLIAENRLVFASHVTGPAIGWPGQLVGAGLAGVAAFAAARLLPRTVLRPRLRAALATVTLLVFVGGLGYFAGTQWP
jgi:hypothetical protein